MELHKLSVHELEAQAKQVRQALEEKRKQTARIEKLKRVISQGGYTKEEIDAALKEPLPATTNGTGPMPLVYFHPTDKSLGWSGKARKPAWLKELLEQGHKLDDLKRRPK